MRREFPSPPVSSDTLSGRAFACPPEEDPSPADDVSIAVTAFAVRVSRDGLHCWASGPTVRALPQVSSFDRINLQLLGGGEFRASPSWAEPHGGMVSVLPRQGAIRIATSAGGIPPIYLYQSSSGPIVASDLRLLRHLLPADERLELDPRAVHEFFQVGYPLDGRTLYRGVRMLSPWTAVDCTVDGFREAPLDATHPLVASLFSAEPADTEAITEAFLTALEMVAVDDSILSLSGGIDSRTVLAGLLLLGRTPRVATLTGPAISLDAQLARSIAAGCGLRHDIVVLGDDFLAQLDSLADHASQFSGGFRSLEFTSVLFLQRQLHPHAAFRISGNGGNQLCRNGLEGLSYRGADPSVLGPALELPQWRPSAAHWLETSARTSNRPLKELLLNCELPWALGGGALLNAGITIEACPYLTPGVVAAALRADLVASTRFEFNRERARRRDLLHRLHGPPRSRSWQRRMLCQAGTSVANVPVNWGWLPRGGHSPRGLGRGLRAGLEARLTARSSSTPIRRAVLRLLGLGGSHSNLDLPALLSRHLRDFTLDAVGSSAVRQAGLLVPARLSKIGDEFFSGHDARHYSTLSASLDLALAQRHFCEPSTDPLAGFDSRPVELFRFNAPSHPG